MVIGVYVIHCTHPNDNVNVIALTGTNEVVLITDIKNVIVIANG